LVNLPLLSNRQNIINNPVKNKASWEEKKHDRENNWHPHHDLGLKWVVVLDLIWFAQTSTPP
jgi:hypothetical protein